MRKHEVLQLLTQHKPELVRRFGVTDLALFGSTARDEASDSSDIDVLVDFDGRSTAKRYFGVQFYLEDQFSQQGQTCKSIFKRHSVRVESGR